MKISINKPAERSYKKLIIITIVTIAAIIVASLVILQSTERLHDYVLYNINNHYIDIEDGDTKVAFEQINYESVIYRIQGISHDKYIEMEIGKSGLYKIEFKLEDTSNYILIKKVDGIEKYVYMIPEYISESGYNKIIITPIEGAGYTWINNVKLHEAIDADDYENCYIVDYEVKLLEIQIDEEYMKSINQLRANALERRIMLDTETVFFPAKAIADGEKYDIDIRLKGDFTDHLQTSKWSYRIKLDNECIWGMEKFSIHTPETRNNTYEYIIHNFYEDNGGVSLYYELTHVVINGEYKGIYALEQAFDKRVIENSLKREGVIIKMDESYKWERWSYYIEDELELMEYAPYVPFGQGKTVKSETLYGYAQYSIDLINKYNNYEIPANEVFDLDLYAKYLALCDVFKATHGSVDHNMRYYYNPLTALLEPITFDMLGNYLNYDRTSNYRFDAISYRLFQDKEFVELYIKYIKQFIMEYDKYLQENEDDIDNFNSLLTLDSIEIPDYENELDEHHKFILDTIEKDLSEFTLCQDNDGNYYINADSNSILNVYIENVLYDGEPLNITFHSQGEEIYLDALSIKDDLSKYSIEYITLFDQVHHSKDVILSQGLSGGDE